MPSTNFNKKIKDYATIAGAVLAASPALNAAVVCSDINQMTTACGDRLFIDMDGDGTNDFIAVIGNQNGTSQCSRGTLHPLASNAVAASLGFYNFSVLYNNTIATAPLGYAYALNYGADIAGNNFLGTGDQRVVLNSYDLFGDWVGNPIDAYAGVQFDIGGNTHYGWLHISYTGGAGGTTHQIEILDAAYEDVPNTTLAAGVTPANCFDPSAAVPTLGQWALINLALLVLTFGIVAIRSMEQRSIEGMVVDSSSHVTIGKPSLTRIKEALKSYFS